MAPRATPQRIAAYRLARSRLRVLAAGLGVLALALVLMFVPLLLYLVDWLPNSALAAIGPFGLSLPAITGLAVVVAVQLDQPGLAWAGAGVLAFGALLAWPVMGPFIPLGVGLLLLIGPWQKARPRPRPPPMPQWQVVG